MRKPNMQSPAIMAGTQNMTNMAQQYGVSVAEDNDSSEEPQREVVKENFVSSQSNEKLATGDPFNESPPPDADSPVGPVNDTHVDNHQIQNMTREQGDGENNEQPSGDKVPE